MKRITALLLILTLVLSLGSALAADPVPVSGITLQEASLTLAVGEKKVVRATVEPRNAGNKTLEWSSSDEAVASVKDGEITGLQAGTASITAAAADGSGAAAKLEVTVVIPVETVMLSVTEPLVLAPHVSWHLTAQALPDKAANRELVWKSSNAKVAAVDEHGDVTGFAPGQAVITVSVADGYGASASLKVTVQKFDLIFEDAQPKNVEYKIAPGKNHHITGHVETGRVRIPEIDYKLTVDGKENQTDVVQVTPLKAGPDVVSVTGTGSNLNCRVYVSPEAFPESGGALPRRADEEGNPLDLRFLNLPWKVSIGEARRLLESQGKRLKDPVMHDSTVRAQLEGGLTFGSCTATHAALDFVFYPDSGEPKEENELTDALLYFDPDVPMDQLRLAVKSVFGVDGGMHNEFTSVWPDGNVLLKLEKKERYTMLTILHTGD